MDGNVMEQDGVKFDTGRKWVNASGVAYRIFQKMIRLGALPNATTISTPHGVTIDPTKMARIKSFWASNGTTVRGVDGDSKTTGVITNGTPDTIVNTTTADLKVTLDATNVNVISANDLHLYTLSEVVIEWAE